MPPSNCSKYYAKVQITVALMAAALILTVQPGCRSNVGGSKGATISGTAVDRDGVGIPDVHVSAYGISTTTDANGEFSLTGLDAPTDRVVVYFQNERFFDASVGQRPAEGATTNIRVVLLPKELVGTVDGAAGGDVAGTGVSVSFETDSFVGADGLPVAGAINIYASYINPDTADFGNAMPGGDFSGTNSSGEDGSLYSYGAVMIGAEDSDANDVRLARDADFCFAIPTSMQADAPDEVPVWQLNPTSAIWSEIAVAVRVGSQYCFFTTGLGAINCDLFSRSAVLTGRVCIEPDVGAPDTTVRVGQNNLQTADDGTYSAIVPSGKMLQIRTAYGDKTTPLLVAGRDYVVDINCGAAGSCEDISDGSFGQPYLDCMQNCSDTHASVIENCLDACVGDDCYCTCAEAMNDCSTDCLQQLLQDLQDQGLYECPIACTPEQQQASPQCCTATTFGAVEQCAYDEYIAARQAACPDWTP